MGHYPPLQREIKMKWLRDMHGRQVRLTDERQRHIETGLQEHSCYREIPVCCGKVLTDDFFIITAYFTDTVRRGEILWERK